MNDDYVSAKSPPQSNPESTGEDSANSVRVFDISEDSISPVNDEPGFFQPPKPVNFTPPSIPNIPKPSQPPQPTRPYIPPDADLLDKKIGTFDTTPFAPPKNAPVAQQPPKTFVSAFNQTPLRPDQNLITKLSPITPQQQKPPTNLPTNQPATNQPIPQQPVTLVPKKPSPIPLQEISFKPIKNVTTPTPAVPQVTPTQPVAPEAKNQTEIAKPLRTYEGDVAEAMSHKRTSRASIAIAESKKQEGEEKLGNDEPSSSHRGGKLILVLLSLILLGGGVIGAYYLYSISPLAPVSQTTPQQKAAPGIIPSDMQTIVTIDEQNPLITQTGIQNEVLKGQNPNTIKELILATKNTSGTLTRVGASEIIGVLDINAPDILTRSLSDNWMLGVYADAENKTSVFVVVTSTFFQNTFAGMLQWESVMADDLKQYLSPIETVGISNTSSQKDTGALPYTNPLDNLNAILPTTASSSAATSTQKTASSSIITTKNATISSTTPEIVNPLQPYVTLRGTFQDRIVKNKDVREFRTDAGTTLFLYSFVDNSHLVITANENTLAEILTRLEKRSFIR